jgi:hypothetical protein
LPSGQPPHDPKAPLAGAFLFTHLLIAASALVARAKAIFINKQKGE